MQRETNETLHIHFGVKTAGLLLLACIFGGIFIPYLFYLANWSINLGVMLFLPISLATVLAMNPYFIQTKRGFCKGFFVTFGISLIILEILAYIWIYQGIIF